MSIELLNVDCMIYMKDQPDNAFDLAIVDPPFGLNDIKKNRLGVARNYETTYQNKETPGPEYFRELSRVAKESIICGCQYFIHHLDPAGSFIVWDKKADPDMHHMSSCEIAWFSKRERIRTFRGAWCGAVKVEPRKTKHPHEKPAMYYKWLLTNYAKPGQRILDTHRRGLLPGGESQIRGRDRSTGYVCAARIRCPEMKKPGPPCGAVSADKVTDLPPAQWVGMDVRNIYTGSRYRVSNTVSYAVALKSLDGGLDLHWHYKKVRKHFRAVDGSD
jgi:site-specific DNA-methyltransferase (adenine-specific)